MIIASRGRNSVEKDTVPLMRGGAPAECDCKLANGEKERSDLKVFSPNTPDDSTLKSLLLSLADSSYDCFSDMGILADYLEDAGFDDIAAGIRWMIERHYKFEPMYSSWIIRKAILINGYNVLGITEEAYLPEPPSPACDNLWDAILDMKRFAVIKAGMEARH